MSLRNIRVLTVVIASCLEFKIFVKMHPSFYPEYFPVKNCKAKLTNKELWKAFDKEQTEMIITKNGRRIFPVIQMKIAELDPQAYYCVFLEMALATRYRLKYSSSVGWSPAGNEEAQSSRRIYLHPESPATGEHWMNQDVSFGRVKLTNTCSPPSGHLVLSSMHKYQPRIILVKTNDPKQFGWAPSKMIVFPETQFIAVTAYQNEKITKLKIDHNPFAKGFRENGKSSKRKHHSEDDSDGEKKISTPSPRESPEAAAPAKMPYFSYFSPYPIFSYPLYPYHLPLSHTYPPLEHQIRLPEPRKITDFSIKAIMGSP